MPPAQEDLRTKFYQKYHHEAEEYDREFINKYNEDMNTTLIFVGFYFVPRVESADPTDRLVSSLP